MAKIESYVTAPSNVDRLVDKVLMDDKLTPAKIRAFASVIQAIKGIPINEPNELSPQKEDNEMMLSDEQPIDMSEVTGFSIDGEPTRKVHIYKTPESTLAS